LRRLGFAVLLMLALAASAAAAPEAPPRAASRAPLEADLLDGVNAFRAEHSLSRLRFSVSLTLAARVHSAQMGREGYFGHESGDGTVFWKRIQSFYRAKPYWSVGENLVWATSPIDAAAVLRLWLASSVHRENLLNPIWRDIGIAALRIPHAGGVFGGATVTIVTADFGVRR
jgi:uncharacterized protein YkwD